MKSTLLQVKQWMEGYGEQYPWLIFVALVFLPGFGFPASILLLLAGMVWGPEVSSALLALAAVALNIIWTHAVANGPGRNLVIRLLGERWQRWKNQPRTDLIKLAVILRLTPGVPLFIQNYVLGLLGVPLAHSLLTALPLTGLYVFGFVLTGGAVFEGQLGRAVTGVCLIVVAGLVVKLVHFRIAGGVSRS